MPKLEGQHPEYIVLALRGYRTGERSHLTMHSQASSLTDQDMADIAAYFSGKPVTKENNPAEGQVPPAAAVCVACHGDNGVGITGQYPTLAGQHADYLEQALHEYRKGGRKNPIMGTFANADQRRRHSRARAVLREAEADARDGSAARARFSTAGAEH